MNWLRFTAAALLAALIASATPVVPALAANIVAIVNDQPITELDLTDRIALLEILDDVPPGGMDKKKALRQLIDQIVKIQEAKRYNMLPSDTELKDRIKRIAQNMKLTPDQLYAKLKAKGISEAAFRDYVKAGMGFNRIIQGKYQQKIKASDAEIDAKMAEIKADIGQQEAKIMNDPRMKGVTVFTLMEINLPVDGSDPMLLQSRAIEADSARLPPQMKAALEKGGVGRAIGPMRGKDGIQLLALCGIRKVSPPKPNFTMPTRQQVENAVLNEKFDKLEEDYLSTVRDKVYVEYRDPSYAP